MSYATDGTESVPAFDCLAACDCGAAHLAPAGGEPPRCACGRAMWWACPVAEMDRQSGERPAGVMPGRRNGLGYGSSAAGTESGQPWGYLEGSGGASRFFPCFSYAAKASGGERDAGCDDLYWRRNPRNPFGFDRVTRAEWEALPEDERARGNVHPTVKRIALMEWLCALVCPPSGRLGDVTLGSGGTAIAWHRICERAGVAPSFLGCDICPEAVAIAEARLAWWRAVRLDTKPVKPDAAARTEDPRQVTIFDMLGGAR